MLTGGAVRGATLSCLERRDPAMPMGASEMPPKACGPLEHHYGQAASVLNAMVDMRVTTHYWHNLDDVRDGLFTCEVRQYRPYLAFPSLRDIPGSRHG